MRPGIFDSPGYRAGWRLRPDHLPITCEGHDVRDRHLCADCAADLRLLLADIPALVCDLQLTITRQTSFVQHGHRRVGQDAAEPVREAAADLPWAEQASVALRRLGRVLGHRYRGSVAARSVEILGRFDALLLDPGVAEWASRLSVAALSCYRAIDRPPDLWFYGPCPGCGADLYDERDVAEVACSACDYRATLAEHQLACLDAGDDRMLTVSELVGAITSAGEVVTRHQIFGWIRREGLPREQENRVVWRAGRLIAERVWVYRLGDVRRLARLAEERKAS